MIKIHKYELDTLERFTLSISAFELLKLDLQDGKPVMWVAENINGPKRIREFRILGIGAELTDLLWWKYMGSVQIGEFVWHYFMRNQ